MPDLIAALFAAALAGSEPAAILLWAMLGDEAAEALIVQAAKEAKHDTNL